LGFAFLATILRIHSTVVLLMNSRLGFEGYIGNKSGSTNMDGYGYVTLVR